MLSIRKLFFRFNSESAEPFQHLNRYVSGYYSMQKRTLLRTSLAPWLTACYTIRKNPKRKIRLDNVVTSDEQGIKL